MNLNQQIVLVFAVLLSMPAAALAAAPTDKCLLDWVETGGPPDEQAAGATGSASESVPASTQTCGRGTSFLNTYRQGVNSVSVSAGGRTFRFLPLALYHKPDATHCDRIKIRNACYEIVQSPGNVSIRLFDRDTRSKGSAEFAILRDGHVSTFPDGRASGVHREFALVRSEYTTSAGNRIVIPDRITERIEAFKAKAQSCAGAAARSRRCLSGLEAAAENIALERLRAERFANLSTEDVRRDRAEMARLIGAMGEDYKVIHEMMLRNELGPAKSPYGLADAGVENSGLSFGVRQLDIGRDNEDAERIFTENLAEFAAAPDWSRLAAHRRFVYSPSFRAPVRKYTVVQLALLHEAVPTLDKMMRTDRARRRYDAHHRKFLTQKARYYAALRKKCLFKEGPYLALAAVDRLNQLAKFHDRVLQKVSGHCRQRSPVQQAEADVAGSFGRYRYRSDNIRNIVREWRIP